MKALSNSVVVFLSLLASQAFGSTLSGTVTRADSDLPVSGAIILIRGTDLFTQSDSQGSYQINGVPAGAYGVSCWAAGLVGQSSGASDLFADRVRNFRLELPALDSLTASGQVRCDGQACAGALVWLTSNGRTRGVGISDATGSFQIAGLWAADYQVQALKHLHRMDQVSLSLSDVSQPVVLDLQRTNQTYTVSGVVGLSDNPLDHSDSLVTVYGQSQSISSITSEGGSFYLHNVPVGLLAMGATHIGYNRQNRIDILVQNERSANFVLLRPGLSDDTTYYRLAGTVYLESVDGTETITAPDSRVSLTNSQGFRLITKTDSAGEYALDAPAGQYQIAVAREGYVSQIYDSETLAADRRLDFNLQLDAKYDWGPGDLDQDLGCRHIQAPSHLLAFFVLLLLLRFQRRKSETSNPSGPPGCTTSR